MGIMSTTPVLYVRRPDAKTVKTSLERDLLLDKRFRMVPSTSDAVVASCFHEKELSVNDHGAASVPTDYQTRAQHCINQIKCGELIAVPVTNECVNRLHNSTEIIILETPNEAQLNDIIIRRRCSPIFADPPSWIIYVEASGLQKCPLSTSMGNKNHQPVAPITSKSSNATNEPSSSLSSVQYALVETLVTFSKFNQCCNESLYREVFEKSVKSLSNRTCPKKLEVIGDDRTLVVPHWAFQLERDFHHASSIIGEPNFQEGKTEFYNLLRRTQTGENNPTATPLGEPDQRHSISKFFSIQSLLWANLAKIHSCTRVARRGDIDPESGVRESGHRILWPIPTDSKIANGNPNIGFMPKSSGASSPGWITVTEHKISQSFDLTRVMFSRGNVTEKKRFGSLVQQGEYVLDMYAGIGYYTLPALVHGNAKHVTACEWNPHALNALRFNLKMNRVADRSVVLEGDCRVTLKELVEKCDKGTAACHIASFDRISLGLLPSCEGGWAIAVSCLRQDEGGWLHIHANVTVDEREKWAHWLCRSLRNILQRDHPKRTRWNAVCTHIEKVKSFAPKVDHVVADVFVGPVDSSKMRLKENATTGVVDFLGKFVPTPQNALPPSCALRKDGVLHQSWLMDNDFWN
mmetsp:Transcript_29015/g.56090  ORF Transcript_29015/g.56090 Transcript_29015/m.56090 type:complete len:634 (-) Transcript_29015:42-1943(-)